MTLLSFQKLNLGKSSMYLLKCPNYLIVSIKGGSL